MSKYIQSGPPAGYMRNVRPRIDSDITMPRPVYGSWRVADHVYICETHGCTFWTYTLHKAERHETRKAGHHIYSENT
jgi:hypothetical protein